MPASELTQGHFSKVTGLLRVLGFFGLIVVMSPIQILLRRNPNGDRYRMPILFHKLLLRVVGLRVRVKGDVASARDGAPVLFVSNHSSYLDIPVLGSLIKGSFVAKSEVAGWPLIGFLAKLQNTVFIERRAVRAGHQRDNLRMELERGASLILFPEGTSSDGHRTLPFKSSLFSIVEGELPSGGVVRVQPVSLVCTRVGSMPMGRYWRPYYAWYGDMTLVKHLWDVFKIADFTVEVTFHPPVSIRDFADRKHLSHACQHAVARGVDCAVTGRRCE